MLVLRRADLETILAQARAAAPEEACGVLGGRERGAERRVEAVHACRNVAPHPQWEFTAEPRDLLRAYLALEEAGLQALGSWHSHPQGPPGPSAVDAARANQPGAGHVVVWLAPREGWGAWRWDPADGFAEEPAMLAR